MTTDTVSNAERECTQPKPMQEENGAGKVVEFGASETRQADSVVDSTSSEDSPQPSACVTAEVDHVLSPQSTAVVDQGHNPYTADSARCV